MTEYKKSVEYQRAKLDAVAWGEQIKYILAQDDYVEIQRNNGERTREYSDGSISVLADPMSMTDLIAAAPRKHRE